MAAITTLSPFPRFFHSQLPLQYSHSKSPLPLRNSKTQFIISTPQTSTQLPPLLPTLIPQNPSKNLCDLLRLSVLHSDIQLAGAVHASVLKFEDISNKTYLFNALILAYLNLGRVNLAHKVFHGLKNPDVVTYTTMISFFSKSNNESDAIRGFLEMRRSGIDPNEYTFVAVLTACSRILNLEFGSQLHSLAIKTSYSWCTFVSNALMNLYGKCGDLDCVFGVFDEMPQRDIASWNTAISALVKEFMCERAFQLFREMVRVEGLRVDHFTISTLLSLCTQLSALLEGRELHAHALRIGLGTNLSVNNALIGFYSKTSGIEDVVSLFESIPARDVITWTQMVKMYMDFGFIDLAVKLFDKMPEKNCISYNALLAGFCQNGASSRALVMFRRMLEESIELDDFSLTSALNACGLLMETKTSEQIHAFVLKFGLRSNDHVEAALLDMCTKCGRMADAEKMFQSLSLKLNQDKSIIWTSMICGYVRNGQQCEALSLFFRSQFDDTIAIDELLSTTVLGICGTLGFHVLGEEIHCYVLKAGLLTDVGVGNALLNMYSKCGNMAAAIEIFNNMSTHDIISWNSLMAGYIFHRQGDDALAVWEEMEKASVQPDSITLRLVVSAYTYTRSNKACECHRFFLSMKTKYDIQPTSEHYASLVGVFGYWGLFKEAEEIISQMPCEPDSFVWRALLHSSRIHMNTVVANQAAMQILAKKPQDPSTYILVSNLYSASGMWHFSEMAREEMREKGFQKRPGQSWIIHQNKVHSFYARDRSHSQCKDIYSGLDILVLECLKAGYVPDTSFVLHEVEEHQKKEFLFYHSAKLAVTYGLLMNRVGRPVRVMKNIVLCGDCHSFLKYVSIITKREIHVRDASGFHCFENGQCSCEGIV